MWWIVLGVMVCLWGCQTVSRPAREPSIDQELITRPSPSLSPPTAGTDTPRPGFEQEPPKSQTP